jgi:hypothetical protein
MRYAVGLYDHAMRGAIAERVADKPPVACQAQRDFDEVRTDFEVTIMKEATN